MRQLWWATSILAGMLLLICWGSGWLMARIEPMAQALAETSTAVREEHWNDAETQVQAMLEQWEEAVPRLELFQSHEDVNEVSLLLREAQMALICQDAGEYAAVSVRLLGELEKLCAMERFSGENLF